MAKVVGLDELNRKLKKLAKKAKKDTNEDVIVGFTQNYAIYVHERTELRHKPGKQAKFLETPARTMQGELFRIVKTVYEKTGSLMSGLTLAGLRLQREAQKITPIETGALKASAFTAKESNAPAKAAQAQARANEKRPRNE